MKELPLSWPFPLTKEPEDSGDEIVAGKLQVAVGKEANFYRVLADFFFYICYLNQYLDVTSRARVFRPHSGHVPRPSCWAS